MLYFFTLLASMYAWIETLRVRLPIPISKGVENDLPNFDRIFYLVWPVRATRKVALSQASHPIATHTQ